jgi:Na+-translocating ferredoxin:NAD+ oxidoreductase RNF subunit RnfB
LNVEEDFIRELFAGGETQLGRMFVNESALAWATARPGSAALPAAGAEAGSAALPSLAGENTVYVLDYERASEVVQTASHIGIGTCYCRHKMGHLGRACAAPMDICMTFNSTARSLIKHGIARQVEVTEGQEILQRATENNLVQFGENVRERVSFICNCCGCCCEAMLAAKRFAVLHPIATTNFLPEIDRERCSGCGKCVEVCPVEAMGLVAAGDPHRSMRKRARVNEELCLGCGLCVRQCHTRAAKLRPRARRVITPVNTAHRTVLMAIERGKLQELIFDDRALFSHRAMAAILGAILKLPPLKQAMASQQMKSRYLERLLSRHGNA